MTMRNDEPPTHDIAWGRTLLVGATLGGLGWGAFAVATIGSRGDEAHLETIVGPRTLVAAAVSAACLILAAALVALGQSAAPSRRRIMRSAGISVVVAVASGWIVYGLAVAQSFLGVWR